MYIVTASKRNNFARGLRGAYTWIDLLNSKESLKYVFIDWDNACCSLTFTHLPIGLVMPPQSEHAGHVGTGAPNVLGL